MKSKFIIISIILLIVANISIMYFKTYEGFALNTTNAAKLKAAADKAKADKAKADKAAADKADKAAADKAKADKAAADKAKADKAAAKAKSKNKPLSNTKPEFIIKGLTIEQTGVIISAYNSVVDTENKAKAAYLAAEGVVTTTVTADASINATALASTAAINATNVVELWIGLDVIKTFTSPSTASKPLSNRRNGFQLKGLNNIQTGLVLNTYDAVVTAENATKDASIAVQGVKTKSVTPKDAVTATATVCIAASDAVDALTKWIGLEVIKQITNPN